MAGLLPLGKQTFTDANGVPLAGGSVAFYVPSTTTPKQTWQDAAASILNTNPVVLDSAGQAVIYGNGAYRQVVKDALGNQIWDQNTANPASILPDPSPGAATYLTRVNAAGTAYENVDPSTIIPASTQTNPNVIDNAAFRVNQRLVTGTVVLAAGAYGHDRWKAGSGGCTYTYSTVGAVTVLSITAGSILQVIEGLNVLDGSYTVSHAGTAQCRLYQNSPGTYAAAPRTTSSITGGSNLIVEFSTGTVSRVKVEIGSGATAFQFRPYFDDLLASQRFYFRDVTPRLTMMGPNSPGVVEVPFEFPTVMRAVPQITVTTAPALVNATNFSITATSPRQGFYSFTMTGSAGSFQMGGTQGDYGASADL